MNDIKELKNDELEKVNGGFMIYEFSIDAGDCFEDERFIFKAISDLPKTNKTSVCIDFHCYDKSMDKFSVVSRNAFSIVNSTTYIGNNVI